MRRLVVILVLALSAWSMCARAAPAVSSADTRSLEGFIEIVRGYDAATVRRTFPAYNGGLFQLVFGSGMPIDLQGEREQAIFRQQLVRTPAGALIDIGHVVTGLEAAGPLPPAARQVEALSGCELRAAVTWSGDVGQALFDFVLSGETDPASFYDRNVPDEDLLGDIDGYLLGAEPGVAMQDIAAILTAAYLDGDLEAHRFGRFLALLGDAPSEYATRQIGCYAAAFAALSGTPVESARVQAATPYFVQCFMAAVRAGADTE